MQFAAGGPGRRFEHPGGFPDERLADPQCRFLGPGTDVQLHGEGLTLHRRTCAHRHHTHGRAPSQLCGDFAGRLALTGDHAQLHRLPVQHAVAQSQGIFAVLGKTKAFRPVAHGVVEQAHVRDVIAGEGQAQVLLPHRVLRCRGALHASIELAEIHGRLAQAQPAFIAQRRGAEGYPGQPYKPGQRATQTGNHRHCSSRGTALGRSGFVVRLGVRLGLQLVVHFARWLPWRLDPQ